MSTFDDDFAASAIPDLFTQFSDSGRVSYAPKNSSPIAITAVVGDERLKDETTDNGLVSIGKRRVTICTDPDSDYGGIANPQLNGVVSVDGIEYAVDQIETVTPTFSDLILKRTVVRELSRANYRK